MGIDIFLMIFRGICACKRKVCLMIHIKNISRPFYLRSGDDDKLHIDRYLHGKHAVEAIIQVFQFVDGFVSAYFGSEPHLAVT